MAKSERLLRRIRSAFDPRALRDICVRQDFSAYADFYALDPTDQHRDRWYWYRDNRSPVLAVAHLDSVQRDPTPTVVHTSAGWLAASGALDDRLGAMVILDLLPKLGITCDILLTTDEETGASTAADFVPGDGHQYNWIFSFDRGGSDVVMYQYETREYAALVEAAGAKVGMGSFSDIAALEHLGVAGFNWGVGYRDYHSPRAHAWLEDTFAMVARFARFHRSHRDVKLVHTSRCVDYFDDGLSWSGEADFELLQFGACPLCREPLYRGFCSECGTDWHDDFREAAFSTDR